MQDNYSQTFFDFSIHDRPNFATTIADAPRENDNPKLHSREVVVDPLRLANRGDISNRIQQTLSTTAESGNRSATTDSSTLRRQPFLESTPTPYARLKPIDLY